MSKWICCQLGAREHYAIPRALASRGELLALVTDLWMPPDSLWYLPRSRSLDKLRERFHPALREAQIHCFNAAFVRFELVHRIHKSKDWTRILARNRLFGQRTIRCLEQMKSMPPATLFTYSYAGLEILRWAKARGWRTVLGQIDPGPAEVEIVRAEMIREPRLGGHWNEPPLEYWNRWKEECTLADTIMVNSQWSQLAVQKAGVPPEKIRVVPLAHATQDNRQPPKKYPVQFTSERPLRVLFLGQINLRKGISRLLRAARMLRDEAVEFWLVGPVQIGTIIPGAGAQIRWVGPVSRALATQYYQEADIFILPTLSDGFALTQLEALECRMPVLASTNCGQVVKDGENGRILPSVSAEAIVAVIRECLDHPARLASWSEAAQIEPEYTLTALAHNLASLA